MKMQHLDCLFVPIPTSIVGNVDVMRTTVGKLHAESFLPLVNFRQPSELLEAAVAETGPDRVITVDVGNELYSAQIALAMGFNCLIAGWNDPDEVIAFANMCREAAAYGIIRFIEPGALEVFWGVQNPLLVAAHVEAAKPSDLARYAEAYRAEPTVETDSQIVLVNSTIDQGYDWQRAIRHGSGYGLLPGLLITDVLEGCAPNDSAAIAAAITSARERWQPYLGRPRENVCTA